MYMIRLAPLYIQTRCTQIYANGVVGSHSQRYLKSSLTLKLGSMNWILFDYFWYNLRGLFLDCIEYLAGEFLFYYWYIYFWVMWLCTVMMLKNYIAECFSMQSQNFYGLENFSNAILEQIKRCNLLKTKLIYICIF